MQRRVTGSYLALVEAPRILRSVDFSFGSIRSSKIMCSYINIGRRQCQGWKDVCVCVCVCFVNVVLSKLVQEKRCKFQTLRISGTQGGGIQFCSARKESGAQLLPDMVGTFVEDNWFGTQVKMLLRRNCKLFGTTLVFFPFNEISLRLNKVFPNSFFQMR